jgi:O-antigen/teichoic acid export membrane protein
MRAAHLLLLFALGRMFGPAALGQFLVGVGLFEIGSGVVATGLVDGTMVFVSRGAVGEPQGSRPELVNVVATALLVGAALAVAVAGAGVGLGALLGARVPAGYAAVMPSIPWIALALLPALVARVSFAASTGFLRPEWEAIAGGAGPAVGVLLALPVVRATGGGSVSAIFVAFLVAQTAVAGLAIGVLARRLGARALAGALLRPRLDRRLLRFALPQGFNMATSAYISRLDLLTLAAVGAPAATVGVYGALSALVVELRQVRMIVSGALAPIIARHHAVGERAAIERLLSRSAAWVGGVIVPVALAFAVVRSDVVAVLAPTYTGGTAFVLLLVVGPLVNGIGGLAGNVLIYLLRNRWNLANAVLVAALGTWIFPAVVTRFGVVGAAICASAATSSITLLETVELWVLENVRIRSSAVTRAVLTLATATVALALLPVSSIAFGARVALAIAIALAAALVIGAPARVFRRAPLARA